MIGSLLAIFSATCFGALGIFARLGYESGLSVSQMLAWRFALTLLPLSLLRWLLHREDIGLKGLGIAVLMGAIGYAGQALLYFSSVQRIGASLTAILLYLYPSFVTLWVWIFDHKTPRGSQWFSLFLAFLGTTLASSTSKFQLDPLGIGLGIGAGLTYSVYLMVSSRILKSHDPWSVSIFVCLGATLSFLTLNKFQHVPLFLENSEQRLIILGLTFISTILPMITIFSAIPRIGITHVSILSTIEPIVTLILGALILHENLSNLQVLGALSILTSVVLLQLGPMTK